MYLDGGSRDVRIGDEHPAEYLVKARGFKDFVVWNPAQAKASEMGDLGGENWDKFVCVEAGSVGEMVKLGKGETWEGSQGISIVQREQAAK